MIELKHAEAGNNGATRLPREQRVVPRLKSQDLMQQSRELEIDHEGRIYRLRVTQLNKLILTA
ncbi:hemin uptake protein HemP [Undibacterium squillarum]|uniref:hemin uptake protein HemP n=1 Tax=Undibacterium squillarum TaxID=1131567 RepID=UPI0035B23548